MDVRIGVSDTARELVVNSVSQPDEIEAQVVAAFAGFEVDPDAGRREGPSVLVPAAKIAYVEIAPADGRRVGFMLAD